MANIEEKVETLVKKPIEELGYELYDVEYAKEGKNYFLRIFIDKEDGIDVDDCEKVNDAITDMLDEADYIKEQYFLEVSSSGIERVLRKDKHLEKYLGSKVEVNLFRPIEKQKQFVGILKAYDSDNITINVDDNDLVIDRKSISLIKTVFDW